MNRKEYGRRFPLKPIERAPIARTTTGPGLTWTTPITTPPLTPPSSGTWVTIPAGPTTTGYTYYTPSDIYSHSTVPTVVT